jgi:ubiquitin carboxyl-terminal hydrolase 10
VKQNYIERLPPVLILHFKRFVYSASSGSQKVMQHVGFPANLSIPEEVLSPGSESVREYTLMACIFHHGKKAGVGHYTIDVKRREGQWLSFDDDAVGEVDEEDVVREYRDKQAYLLFYARREESRI